MIEDYILMFAQWGLAPALIPMLLHPTEKPAFISSVWTGLLLVIMGCAFFSLELWGSSASAITVAAIWFVLAYQRYRLNQRTGVPLVRLPYWMAYITPLA